ncbi:unnamed protein product, partial [Didymodactylos carnosus]
NCPIPGSALRFAILAGSTVSSTGLTNVTGDLGISPSVALTGFSQIPGANTGFLNGSSHLGDETASKAKSDVKTAYHLAAGFAMTRRMTGVDIAGQILAPGVYKFDSDAALKAPNGNLTLTGPGIYVFQIGSTLITSGGSQILLVNGATAGCVYWQVGSSATLGINSQFVGIIMAQASIGFDTNASLLGSAFALDAAVTLNSNRINVQPACKYITKFFFVITSLFVSMFGVLGTILTAPECHSLSASSTMLISQTASAVEIVFKVRIV